MTADVSRNFADRDKLFRTVVRQQGRLPTDAEENHDAELRVWGHDDEFVDTIAALGTPDDGFKIVVPAGVDDAFDILAGSYYLGGARVENPATLAYADQVAGNWLTQDEPVTADSRVVVWLEVEERIVTAVQDSELLEPALRGADGSGRTRLCWRVRQAPTTEDDCEAALDDVLDSALVDARDHLTGALAAAGTLTVGFDKEDVDLDLCKPAVEPGYLGNRNNAYRIKRTRAGRFVWGEDNAAQLYRVTVDADRHTIRFLTEPRDEYLRPRVGQTVELLRGDVLLPNFERVAELDNTLFRVTGGYQDRAIVVGANVSQAVLNWAATVPQDPRTPAGTPRHLYLRVWTGGGDGVEPDVAFVAGTEQTLVGTGLTLKFDGATLAGDGWTCSARPHAPTRVLPWALRDGMTAHGPRRHVAALAIVDLATGEVHDCRPRFRPLDKIRTCCTVTVGPPGSHVGDVDSIAAAIDLVPPEGGTACLLAGEHPANVKVAERRDIRFTGCPGKTTWVADDPAEPLVTIIDTLGVGFSDIAFVSGEAPAIISGRSAPDDDGIPHGELLVSDCSFDAPAGCAVTARSMEGATLLRCHVQAGPFPEAMRLDPLASLPAVFLQGERLVVERCEIIAGHDQRNVAGRLALGGIQIGGSSIGVMIRDCLVRDGAGIGITLGSIAYVRVPAVEFERDPDAALTEGIREHLRSHFGSVNHGIDMLRGFHHVMGDDGCVGVEPTDPEPEDDGGGGLEVPVSEGMVEDVEILHNRILGMGSSGIATYPLALAFEGSMNDAIAVDRLIVADNLIADCVQLEVNVRDDLVRTFYPVGGIALAIAIDCVFRGNEIVGNGSGFGGGTCGIGIVYGEDVRVVDNRIEANGIFDPERPATGPNAGVHVTLAHAGLRHNIKRPGGSDAPALSLHGNMVSQPAGRALRAMARGPVVVVDNRLVGGNPSRLFNQLLRATTHLTYATGLRSSVGAALDNFDLRQIDQLIDLLGGDAVNLVNLGVASDLEVLMKTRDGNVEGIGLVGMFASVAAEPTQPTSFTHLPAATHAIGPRFQFGGTTMVNDNQVSLHLPIPGGPPSTVSSIMIAALDDVSFADNQYGIEADIRLALVDALILGMTVRINGNRGQEAANTFASILSLALLWNTAALNQTTAPILVFGLDTTEVLANISA